MSDSQQTDIPGVFLLAAVFIIAVCGLIYELVAASLSSYLLGSSVTHFSIVIGVFLTAMGLGSYLTRFVKTRLMEAFVLIQMGIGFFGGLSAAILLATFAFLDTYLLVLILLLLLIGSLVGMEIPVLIRILKDKAALRITVSNVLALDYVGALVASCAFPLILAPSLGLLRTSLLFGLINVAVAMVAIRVLSGHLKRKGTLKIGAGLSVLVLGLGLIFSGSFTSFTEDMLYQDDIILARQTKYQRLIVTKWRNDIRLYIDGNLQFSTVDEHRYHEALVHPAAALVKPLKRVLILGGGDGMAAREVLKYPDAERIDLVDLDRAMIDIFRDMKLMASLSGNALADPRVEIHVIDAQKYLSRTTDYWDLIIMDLPDPNNLSVGRLYTRSFFRLVFKRLSAHGVMVTQATSPFYAPKAFWCIVETINSVGNENIPPMESYAAPFHVYVPSFGDWGFVMASKKPLNPSEINLVPGLELGYLDQSILPTLFVFPKDSLPREKVETNRLNDQILVKYYQKGWRRFGP
jgi:spermidine synthase